MERPILDFYIGEYNIETKKYDDYSNTLLMIIDIQEKLMPAIFGSEKLIKKTKALIDVCELVNIKKIATEQYPKGLGKSVEEILSELSEEEIFEKTSFNALTKEVKSYLEINDIKSVIITGAEAHVCVYQTVRELIKLGIKVFIVEDAISSYDKEKKNLGLNTMEKIGAVRVNIELILFDLMNDSKNPNFKEVSKLVKELRK